MDATESFGPFVLDRARGQVLRDGQPLVVSQRGLVLLDTLLSARGHPVSKETLLEKAWQGAAVEEGNLTVQISTLRRQLGDDGAVMIVTVPRVGYRLVAPHAASAGNFTASGPAAVAVLRFDNQGDSAADGYFADGVVDDITTALSRFKSFAVMSRSAAFALSTKGHDALAAAAGLGVRYALDGSVRRSDDRLRLSAKLLDTRTGAQLWGDRYEGGMADVFAFQDRITESIVGVIEPTIRQAEIERARRKPTSRLDAYDLFLRALPFIQEPGTEAHPQALMLLLRAAELDPSFALAPAHAAWLYEKRISLRETPLGNDDAADCITLARKALRLGKDDPLVRAICGWVLFRVAGELSGVEAVRQAVAENPNNTTILTLAAAATSSVERGSEEAYRYSVRGYELSPGAPEAYQHLSNLGGSEYERGNYEAAIGWCLKSLATFNGWLYTYITLAASYAMLDRMEEARAALSRVRELSPHLTLKLIEDGKSVKDAFADAVIPGLRKAGLPES